MITLRVQTTEHHFEQSCELLDSQSRDCPIGQIHWRWSQHSSGWRLSIDLEARIAPCFQKLSLLWPQSTKPRSVLSHGHQSWTNSQECPPEHSLRPMSWLLRPLAAASSDEHMLRAIDPQPKLWSWHWCFLRDPDLSLRFFGSLAEHEAYTLFDWRDSKRTLVISRDISGYKAPKSFRLFQLWFSHSPHRRHAYQRYGRALGLPQRQAAPILAWTSWYYHDTHISEPRVLENLDAFKDSGLPLSVFQIDDGYQTALGDWRGSNDKFPRGLGFLAEKIREAGAQAGLWLAPFVCQQHSSWAKKHPQSLLRDARGRPIKAGFNPLWKGFFYALDIDHPGLQEELRQVFDERLKQQGFGLLKLDFLYAASLSCRADETRAQRMHRAMSMLRDWAGDKLLLGCGVPIAAASGQVDYCRVGADITETWDIHTLRLLRCRERLSTVNAIRSMATRAPLSGRFFLNDPDVFMLRDESNKLSQDQRLTLLLAQLLFGHMLITSDDLRHYSPQQMTLLKSLFPLRSNQVDSYHQDQERIEVHLRIQGHAYFAVLNLSAKPISLSLPAGQSFSESSRQDFVQGPARPTLRAYQSRLFLCHRAQGLQVLESNGHFFPGAQLDRMELTEHRLELSLNPQAPRSGWLRVGLPESLEALEVCGQRRLPERWQGFSSVLIKHQDIT